MTPLILSLIVKVTLILALGLLAAASLRNFGPAIRHQVLLVTLGSCVSLPIFMVVAPRWDVRVLPPVVGASNLIAAASPGAPAGEARVSNSIFRARATVQNSADANVGGWSRSSSLLLLWALGFLGVLIWLATGRIRLRRIAAASWPLTGADWERALNEERRDLEVSRPVRLLSSSVVSTPLTWGLRAPVILLPEDALDWPEAHRRIVLRHELAHVARADALSQLVAGFVCALYWFHPLVWLVERRMRAECERACDARVVALGTPAAEYASHLLEVARSARSFGAPGFLSVAMARPSQLEGRLLAVLNESPRRASISKGARWAAVLVSLFVLIAVSAFRAVPRTAPSATAPSSVKEASIPVDSTFDRSVPAKNGGTLTLDLRTGGRVNIVGWSKDQVSVQARLSGPDWRNTAVSLSAVDGGARLASEYTGHSNTQSYDHTFEIHVPRSFNVQLSSAGGGVSISDVDGVFNGQTGGGQINIERVNGEVDIRTGGGQIHVSDSRLNGTVRTGGGAVTIERVTGNLEGKSGGGPVIYTKSGASVTTKGGVTIVGVGSGDYTYSMGKGSSSGTTTTTYTNDGVGKTDSFGASGIRMSSAGGAITVPSAPEGARVTTGGGRIRIGPSGGEVYAQTGGGSIDIGPATGSVEAHTGAGDVTIELKGAGPHSADVTSGKGEVVLLLPAGLDAVLELETAYTDNLGHKTRIISDWPVQPTESDWDNRQGTPRRYVRARQSVGKGGGVVRVRTVNGNIVVKRT